MIFLQMNDFDLTNKLTSFIYFFVFRQKLVWPLDAKLVLKLEKFACEKLNDNKKKLKKMQTKRLICMQQAS